MRRDIDRIRKNINDRKRDKKSFSSSSSGKYNNRMPFQLQEEEKHGYSPFSTDTLGQARRSPENRLNLLLLRVIIAACLFFVVAILSQTEVTWLEKPKGWVVDKMEEDFPFAAATAWYKERFGEPLELVRRDETTPGQPAALPVNGTVSENFQSHGKGVVMTADEPADIVAMDSGTVVFAGKDSQTDQTIILQHADGSKSVYGYLSSIDVHLYESVAANATIGKISPEQGSTSTFFFAIEKDDRFIDPIQVIQVDEQP
ncbi:peptidoglycan DD-metalloendopeptidase family protein [Thalassobacillus hwangdonensis]|uniref:Peptidoglycan DD-metalloendopeptidase family protein n=1 Tax=Thalassobacillus hwangdonensis TaxID=546108 RepID=A0ABW3KZC4_9BACI